MSIQPEAQQVMTLALGLQAQDRAALAAQLISSLDDETDHDADQVWEAEVQQRYHEYIDGNSALLSWDEVQNRMDKRLQR